MRGSVLAFLLALLVLPLAIGPAAAADVDFTADGLARHYILVTPKRPGPEPLPLIIVLHGTYGTGAKMELVGFNDLVERYRFAVAYPDAAGPLHSRRTWRWNDGRGTLESSKKGVDDVSFMRHLVDDIGRRMNLDRRRVFIAGASNGGIMAYRIGCEAADLVAGIAPVIGDVAVSVAPGCKPSRPISVLAINGVDDPIMPFAGGTVCRDTLPAFCERGEVIGAEASLARFARAAGCAPAPSRAMLPPKVADGTTVEKLTYPSCAPGTRVGAYWLHGAGHAWPPMPGQLGERRGGHPSHNLDATEAIVRFFLDPGHDGF